MLQRGQTATEYIIVVAVVLVISLVGAAILGSLPSIGSESDERVERSSYLTKEVAIDTYGVESDSSTFVIRNNYPRKIQVSDASVEGINCNSSNLPVTLKPGQKFVLDCEANSSQVTSENPDVNFLWCDVGLQQAYDLKYGNSDANYNYNGTCGIEAAGSAPASFCTSATAGGFYFNGTGTLADPYGVCNCSMLEDIHQSKDANFTLLQDIDCSMSSNWDFNGSDFLGFDPIGQYNGFFLGGIFNGSLDGAGYSINDLYIYRPDEDGVGLFSAMHESSSIYNLTLTDSNVTGDESVASLVGLLYSGSVNETQTSGVVSGRTVVGGMLGYILSTDSKVHNSTNYVDVTATAQYAGAFAAYVNAAEVKEVLNYGNLDSTSRRGGGISGVASGGAIISKAGNYGNVTSTLATSSGGQIGGITGWMISGSTSIDKAFNAGTVTAEWNDVGGIVGDRIQGTPDNQVSNAYNLGNITGPRFTGGIVGSSSGDLTTNSYNKGNVTATIGDHVGGIIGFNQGTISNSYSNGTVVGIGGFIGEIAGRNTGSVIASSAQTKAGLRMIATYPAWDIQTSTVDANNGYPYFAWQTDDTGSIWKLFQ